jgi:hypothetical protein
MGIRIVFGGGHSSSCVAAPRLKSKFEPSLDSIDASVGHVKEVAWPDCWRNYSAQVLMPNDFEHLNGMSQTQ